MIRILIAVLIFFVLANFAEYKAITEAYQKNGFMGAMNVAFSFTIHKVAGFILGLFD